MFYICYQSQCNIDLSHQEITRILEKSRTNNNEAKITGILLIINNTFVQILEGDQKQVEMTFKKICLDNRHNKIIKLMQGELKERCFPTWSMGYKLISTDKIDDLNKYIDISSRTIKNIDDNSTDNELFLSFLKSFY